MQHQNTIVPKSEPPRRSKCMAAHESPLMKCSVSMWRECLFICTEFSFIKVVHGGECAIAHRIHKRLKDLGEENASQPTLPGSFLTSNTLSKEIFAAAAVCENTSRKCRVWGEQETGRG